MKKKNVTVDQDVLRISLLPPRKVAEAISLEKAALSEAEQEAALPATSVAQAEDVHEAEAASVAETDPRGTPARRGVLSEIRRLQQNRSSLMIPKTAFSRL